MQLQTERLILRELTEGDLPDLAAQLQDPLGMTAYEHAFTGQEVQEWLDRNRRRYVRDGFGLWAVVERDSGRFAGQAGITWQEAEGRRLPEVGYLLRREFWHRGYATEAAAACRDYALGQLGFERVYSVIKADNFPSIAVARRLGMRCLGEFTAIYFSGPRRHLLYGISREEWRAVDQTEKLREQE